LAKALKYYFSFLSQQSGTHRVEFWFEGFTGDATEIQGGQRPIILSEYNTNEDLFKPYRPFQAEIEVLSSSTTVQMEDFIADNDNDIEVKFYHSWPNRLCWQGFLVQDNFQEIWQDTNHYLKLSASEGIGYLDNVQFNNNGVEVTGRITPLETIEYCLQDSSLPLGQYTAFNNLFHSSMDDASTKFPLDQCFIDAKTFQIETTDYDTKLTALNKINSSFSQTIFQYRGKWFIQRVEEWYVPNTDNLRGFSQGASTRTALNRRYDIEVGVGENVKPIAPEMIRYIVRKTKKDQVQYNYTPFNEVLPNESFTRGDILSTNPSVILRQLDNWIYTNTNPQSASAPTNLGDAFIIEEYFDDILQQRYGYFNIPVKNVPYYIKSEWVEILENQVLDLQFEVQYKDDVLGTNSANTAVIVLTNGTTKYYLDNNGKWTTSTATLVGISVDFDGNAKCNEWNTINVISDAFPVAGTITIYFSGVIPSSSALSSTQYRIKNLTFKVLPAFQVDTERRNITGQIAYFEKSETLRNKEEFEIFFDDGFSKSHKGTIYELDESTMTNKEWYRYRFPNELQNFKKEALIAQWEHNRFNRNKLDVTFWGLFPDLQDPIGLMNTIKFVDDDPNKVYAILNMKEMNFMENTWTATLIEVYDNDKDDQEPPTLTFNADVIDGTYSGQTYVPFVITSAADMTISSSYIFSYNGDETITVNIACSVGGTINSASGGSVTLKLQKNGTDINTQTITINSLPEPFNVTLNTNSVQLTYLDNFEVLIDSNISDIVFSTGSIGFSYTSPVPFIYNDFTQKFISN